MTRTPRTTTALLCLVLAACAKPAATPQDDVRPVRSMTVSLTRDAVQATYSGEIRARVESRLGFKVAGKVMERLVEVGAHVMPGQPLLRLDPHDSALSAESSAAQTEAAQIKLRQSRVDLERYERLFDERFISKAALDQYKLNYETAASQLKSAQAQQRLSLNQRAYTVLTADRAGVITAIDMEVGQVISAGQPVLTLAADGAREVLVSIPESRVEEVRRAKQFRVSTWVDPQHFHAATLRELAPDADKATRTYAARIAIADHDDALRLGMTASVQVENLEEAAAIRVPLSAIHHQDHIATVWVIEPANSTLASRPVTLGAASRDSVQVFQGLHEGEVIVTAGGHLLHAGQKVKVLPSAVMIGSAS